MRIRRDGAPLARRVIRPRPRKDSMIEYAMPTAFLCAGLLQLRPSRGGVRGDPLSRVLGFFALGAGAFLLLLTYMCNPG